VPVNESPGHRQEVAGCLDGLLLPVAVVAAWICVAFVHLSNPCGGDGGSPYAEPGSRADHFCSGGGQVALWLLPATGAIVGLIIRIHRRGSTWWPWATLAAAIALDLLIVQWSRGLAIRS
jgi:hypothetical protein